MKRLFVGLDLSLAGTAAVAINEKGRVKRILAFSSAKRELLDARPDVDICRAPAAPLGDPQASWNRTRQVARIVRHWVAQQADDTAVVGLEDHAYGARGTAIYQLGHLHGLVRDYLSANLLPFLLVEPTTVKLYATGAGRAEKADVIRATLNAGFDVGDFGASTRHNVADAYWIAQLARVWNEAGPSVKRLDLASLPPHQRRVFLPSKRAPGLLARKALL